MTVRLGFILIVSLQILRIDLSRSKKNRLPRKIHQVSLKGNEGLRQGGQR